MSLSQLSRLTEPCLNDITTYLSPLVAELAASAAPLPPKSDPEIVKLNKLRQLLYAQLGRESRYNMHVMQDHELDVPVRILELETDVLAFIHKQALPVPVLFECEVDAQHLWRIASRYPTFHKRLLDIKTKHQLLEEAYRYIKVAKLKAVCEDPLGDVAYVQALIELLELALSDVHG